jgi:hypothetical protein
MQMDQIDANVELSDDVKYHQRSKTAAEALAEFEASKTLARACQAVEFAAARHNLEQNVSLEIAQDSEAMLKAMKDVERGWQRAMDKIAERVSFAKNPQRR